MQRSSWWASLACVSILGCSTTGSAPKRIELIPDVDRTRTARIAAIEGRFIAPEGFTVEQVATDELVGSIVNMTFDHLGRPALSAEGGGIRLLFDDDGDGLYDRVQSFSEEIQTAHGMYYIGAGDLLVHSEGPEGTGLYRLTDSDGDDEADRVVRIAPSQGKIGEHGPHTIMTGLDGFYYVLFGNHAHPDVELDPASPSRGLREDHLLPRYLDPRGHANDIRVPGGTVHRLSPDLSAWSQIASGFRNAFDMAADISGEIFVFDSDMEWDVGLPWYRPIRVVHAIPGGDYGWRTGSSKLPFYYIDTLPSVDDVGRGSPVGVAFYYHNIYPEQFDGALFLGDWSRGRIRIVFPEREGASYSGEIVDFLLGEPLNITDLDVGPDGFLYFTTGGRLTTGGLYRVRYTGPARATAAPGIDQVLAQPMPRSAWGREALRKAKREMGDDWEPRLRAAALDGRRPVGQRLRALESLQALGPKPERSFLEKLARDDREPALRGAGVSLLGTMAFDDVREPLTAALADPDPLVQRRACESLVRAGLDGAFSVSQESALLGHLESLLGSEDRFVRYAARLALMRVERSAWVRRVADRDARSNLHRSLEGLLALVYSQETPEETEIVFRKLEELSRVSMNEAVLVDFLRVLQLALIRDPSPDASAPARQGLIDQVGPRLLERFPAADRRANRELQVVLASMQTPGAIQALLDELDPDDSQQEQIHTVYALRALRQGWTPQQRRQLIDWFDRAWRFRGAASMEGYINALWESSLQLLTEEERGLARARRDEALAEAARRAELLAAPAEGDDQADRSANLTQMSFEELSEYLEYDPMAYERGSAERGRRVFYRARCVNCHVFGSEGRGGGPDLSTVVTRFRRREILESIMYPSRVISDQYTALWVDVSERDAVTGMLVGETDSTLTLIDATGVRIEIPKEEIVDRRPSRVSIMPEGLLDVMTVNDLVDLVLFLERGAEEPAMEASS